MTFRRVVRELNSWPPVYCPYEDDKVLVGVVFVGSLPPGATCVGQYWYDTSGELVVELSASEERSVQ